MKIFTHIKLYTSVGFLILAMLMVLFNFAFFKISNAQVIGCNIESRGFIDQGQGPLILEGPKGSLSLTARFVITYCTEQTLKNSIVDQAQFGVVKSNHRGGGKPSAAVRIKVPFNDFKVIRNIPNSDQKDWQVDVTINHSAWLCLYESDSDEASVCRDYDDLKIIFVSPHVYSPAFSRILNNQYLNFYEDTIEVTVTSGEPSREPPADESDYGPIADSIKVCKYPKDSTTGVRVFWLTKGKANSAINYKEAGTSASPTNYGKPNYLTDHFLTLNLKANIDYIFQVGGRSETNIKYELSGVGAFKTGERNDPGCKDDGTIDPQTNTNTNSSPPNNSKDNNSINTGINADFNINLDENLGTFFNPLIAKSVPEIIASIIRILFLLISIAAVVIIIVSGFRMVLASGNEEQLTKAKKAITWAIIGLIVSLMSFSIVAIIQNLISRQS